MANYAKLDFPTWSARAELVDNVHSALPEGLFPEYPAEVLSRPGYVFHDGPDDIPQSFIIADDSRRWWSILWTGERIQADNLLDVAIDIWQSRMQTIL